MKNRDAPDACSASSNLSLTEELHSGGGAWPAAPIRATAKGVNVQGLPQGVRKWLSPCAPAQLVVTAGNGIAESGLSLVVVMQHLVDGRRPVRRRQAAQMAGQLVGTPSPHVGDGDFQPYPS